MGKLRVQLVDTQPIYTDEGTGADDDVAIYEPVMPEGWYFLGHLARPMPSNYSYTDRSVVERAPMAVVVQSMDDDLHALSPVEPQFEAGTPKPLWTDQHSGGSQNIEIFAFTPTDTEAAYVPMGLFASIVRHYGEDPRENPIWSRLVAVREDLVVPGQVGTEIYKDKGSGANGDGLWRDISLWGIEGQNGLVPSATFVAAEGYPEDPASTVPAPHLLANVLEN
jgi:hypothetical protein